MQLHQARSRQSGCVRWTAVAAKQRGMVSQTVVRASRAAGANANTTESSTSVSSRRVEVCRPRLLDIAIVRLQANRGYRAEAECL